MLHRRLPRLDLRQRTYYLTVCTDQRRHLFQDGTLAAHLISLYGAEQEAKRIVLHGYVAMPDHYHVLLTLVSPEKSISDVARAVHSLFARPCRARTGLQGRVWQERFYDHVIRSDEEWRTKLTYIHDNPVRKLLVARASDYPWSSASFWETGRGHVQCEGLWWD